MQNSVTVRELCGAVELAFETLFAEEIWVRGTISGLNRSQNGHVYFDLVDRDEFGRQPEAVLPVALFANNKFRVNAILKKTANSIRMEDGIEIQIRGRVAYYPKQSRVQLIMSLIDPSFTLGQMEANRVKVLASLEADGLLRANGALVMPAIPLRIGLITSVGSAAEADFVNEISLCGLPFEITIIDARVQGTDAISSLARALAVSEDFDLDVVALVRGGGARTDLMAFDDEAVARAIANCTRPVITGIGHETDRSIADEVAHRSAKTPTACAGLLIEMVLSFAGRVERAAEAIARRAQAALVDAEQHLATSRARIGRVASNAVERQGARIELAADRIQRAATRCLEREADRFDRCDVQIRSLDPATAMARGWSITRTADGTILRSAALANDGDVLITTLADGEVRSTVESDG